MAAMIVTERRLRTRMPGRELVVQNHKAARTVVALTERLDHHRGRGQQQISVKHVTVNADQAIVAENVTTAAPALQANAPVEIEQILQPELVGTGRGQKPK